MPAFFANLLPEGRRLTALRRATKTSADDELSLLVAVGSDPVGDVQVLATPEPSGEAAPDHDVPDLAELDFAALLKRRGIGDPSALAGVQDKVSGRMLTLPLEHAGRAHLLKFEVPEFPQVVSNEAYFLGIARRMRMDVADAEVIHDVEGRPGLLVTRFDRTVTPRGLRRLAVEDGAQLLDRHPADKYGVTTEDLLEAVARVARSRPVAVRAVLQQVAFAWLTGNGDLHAKNISVLDDDDRRVAPVYDIPATVPYGDTTMALSVAGRRDNLSTKAFHALGAHGGLPTRAVDAVLEEALRATASVADDIEAGSIHWDPRRRRDLANVIRRRRRDLGA